MRYPWYLSNNFFLIRCIMDLENLLLEVPDNLPDLVIVPGLGHLWQHGLFGPLSLLSLRNLLLLLDHVGWDDLKPGLLEELLTLTSEEVCSEGRLNDGVLEDVAIVYRDGASVGGARVHHEGRGAAVGKCREDRVLDEKECWHVIFLKHDLAQLLSPVLLVPGRLAEEHGVVLGLALDDLLVGVVKHLLEHVPVRDHAVPHVGRHLHPRLGEVEGRGVNVELLLRLHVSGVHRVSGIISRTCS